MRLSLIIVSACLALLCTVPVVAQPTTVKLVGRVRSASSGRPLAGVQVVVKSPLLKLEQATITDPRGGYEFTQLPPGTDYEVSFGKQGFHPLIRGGIRLKYGLFGFIVHADGVLVPHGFQGGIEVYLELPFRVDASRALPRDASPLDGAFPPHALCSMEERVASY